MANMVRWTPTRNPRTLDRVLDDLWRSSWQQPEHVATDTARPLLRPAMDVAENEDQITVQVDLPGLRADDVTVEVEGDLLTISGERGEQRAGEQEQITHRERRYGAFKRSLRLGDQIDAENVAATFENGVLTLVLPKKPEAQPKRITVQRA